MLNLKSTLLPLVVAMAVLPLAACSNNDTADTPADTENVAVIETDDVSVVEPEVMTKNEAEPMAADMAATQNIAEMAAENDNLTILTAALKASGLDVTLMSTDSQFTVFAPTDDAFSDLLNKLNMTQEDLLADKDMLTKVLSYHVIPDMAVEAADIPHGTDIETVNGQALSISDANVITDASGNTANIVQTDMMATNGVVHVIDKVLMPAM